MKKTLTLALFIFALSFAQAQIIDSKIVSGDRFQDNWQHYYSQYHAFYRGMFMLAYTVDYRTDSNLVSEEVQYYKYKKGVKPENPRTKAAYTFSNGRLINYRFIKKEKVRSNISYEYNEDGYYTRYYVGTPTKPKFEEVLVYNDSNRVTAFFRYNKKRKLKRKETMKYNENQKVIQKDIYDGKHAEPKFTWKYHYNEEGQKSQTEYFKKGKLKSKWVFTCDDEGEKVENKNIRITTTCSLVEHNNDGSYVKIYRNTGSKGKVVTSRWTYSKDSLLIAYEKRNHKDKVISKHINEYDAAGNRITYTYFKKGGEKISHSFKFQYNTNKKIVAKTRFNSKGIMKSKTTLKYNNDGRIIERSVYNSKNEVSWKYAFTYNEKGILIAEKTYKKNTPINERNFLFQY